MTDYSKYSFDISLICKMKRNFSEICPRFSNLVFQRLHTNAVCLKWSWASWCPGFPAFTSSRNVLRFLLRFCANSVEASHSFAKRRASVTAFSNKPILSREMSADCMAVLARVISVIMSFQITRQVINSKVWISLDSACASEEIFWQERAYVHFSLSIM